MRILTFTSLFPNSVQPTLGVFVYQRMAHVSRRPGSSVAVVAPVPYFPQWLRLKSWQAMSQIPKEEQIGELKVYHPRYLLLPKVSMPVHGVLMFLGCLRLMLSLKKRLHFECIDAHFVYPDGFAAVLLGKLLGVPVVVSARGTDMNLYPAFRLIRPTIAWTLRRAAGLIAVCTALKEAMVEMGAAAEKVRVIGNGVDVQRFQPEDRGMARRRLGIPEDAQVIVAVGALIPRKGCQFLIPAFAQVREQLPKLRLYLVGEGESRRQLELLARNLGVQDHVFLPGMAPNEELKYWYSAAQVSCLVSSREGWPNVLLESMACGTPVVATRVWGVPEVITTPELGIMVEQNSADIARGLERALEKRWDRGAVAEYARRRTWEVVAEEVDDYLAGCVGKSREDSARS